MCDSKIKYRTLYNILTTQGTEGKAITLIWNFPAIATFYRHLPSGLFSKKCWRFGVSANFLFAIAHFQVGLVFWGCFWFCFFLSLHIQLIVILSFWGEEGCASHIYEMLEREGGWWMVCEYGFQFGCPPQFACCSAGILGQLLFSVLIFGFWWPAELQTLLTFSAV